MYKWCIQVSKECLSLVQQSKETVKMLNAVEKCCLRVLEQCERSKYIIIHIYIYIQYAVATNVACG